MTSINPLFAYKVNVGSAYILSEDEQISLVGRMAADANWLKNLDGNQLNNALNDELNECNQLNECNELDNTIIKMFKHAIDSHN